MAAVWRTARQVGGDFYDVFELPNRRLGLLIADVSDKGIPAALFMALTRTLIRAAVLDADSPAQVLKRVNDLIIPDNREEMFVTAVYGVLDIDTGQLTYANAGHNPPIWLNRMDRELVHLGRTCAALGIIEDMPVEERSISLRAGDTVLFYTDGLTEAFSQEDEAFGVENLEKTLVVCWDETAARTLELLEKDVDKFLGSLQATDDLTMLALRRKNQA
jgi:serine phosphatase RsbU (regulator of sigma subunit)